MSVSNRRGCGKWPNQQRLNDAALFDRIRQLAKLFPVKIGARLKAAAFNGINAKVTNGVAFALAVGADQSRAKWLDYVRRGRRDGDFDVRRFGRHAANDPATNQ